MLVSLPALSLAQSADEPPPLPYALVYGEADGAVAGQSVTALITTQGKTVTCGTGQVIDDPEAGIVYAIDVEHEDRIAGCGAAGRNVRLYFGPVGSTAGRFANETLTLGSGDLVVHEFDVTLAAPMNYRLLAPQLAARVTR